MVCTACVVLDNRGDIDTVPHQGIIDSSQARMLKLSFQTFNRIVLQQNDTLTAQQKRYAMPP